MTSSDIVRPWYAIRVADPEFHALDDLWLVDTCAGGTYSAEFGASMWFDSAEEARDALISADIGINNHQLVQLHADPEGGNHHHMTDVEWP